jgi:hypothetical protein
MSEDKTQSYQEMYQDDGYVESGVAEPGTMQEVDMAGEGDLEQEYVREEVDEGASPLEEESRLQRLSTPLEQKEADPYAAVDMGYKEDPDAVDSEVEGFIKPTTTAETIDPLEGE